MEAGSWYHGCGECGLVLVPAAGFSSYLLHNRTGFQRCRHPSAFDSGDNSGLMVSKKRRPWVSVIVSIRRLIETTVTYFWLMVCGDGRLVLELIAGYSSHLLCCIIRF